MINLFSKYKIIFYSSNFILMLEYLFPGSLLGCIIFNNCKIQLQITPDFLISTNHLYSFLILSLIGFYTYKNSKYLNILTIYLLVLSVILEIMHYFIPNRSFEYQDLFGNLAGVIFTIILFNLFKRYEETRN
ncbi:VanZ family protein [Pelagibacterales bacterium SAG-MED43]|nr:VanZ family protein [Pelagibacterales bacterium SAG-MED44]MBD1137969.1 VanZ family protein [Pelagibacterales bacterium SAG-MED43]